MNLSLSVLFLSLKVNRSNYITSDKLSLKITWNWNEIETAWLIDEAYAYPRLPRLTGTPHFIVRTGAFQTFHLLDKGYRGSRVALSSLCLRPSWFQSDLCLWPFRSELIVKLPHFTYCSVVRQFGLCIHAFGIFFLILCQIDGLSYVVSVMTRSLCSSQVLGILWWLFTTLKVHFSFIDWQVKANCFISQAGQFFDLFQEAFSSCFPPMPDSIRKS